VLAAADAAGAAAVQLDGRMIDKPVIERARRVVQRSH
jgi:citrate lyase subunit beta/citryl-CoA lyase